MSPMRQTDGNDLPVAGFARIQRAEFLQTQLRIGGGFSLSACLSRFPTTVRPAGVTAVIFLFLGMAGTGQTAGQTERTTDQAADADLRGGVVAAADALSIEQQRIADKYKRLEDTLLRMAELTAVTDPRRAALLKKAVAQSKEQLIGLQLDALVELLEKGQLSRAIGNQEGVDGDLRDLLELLLSENRAKRIESEKARIRDYLKRLNQIIKTQKDVQGRTAGGGDQDRLADEQGKLSDTSDGLADDIRRNEESESDGPEQGAGQDTKDGDKGGTGKQDRKKPEDGSRRDSKDAPQSPDPKEPGADAKDGQEPDGNKADPKGQGRPEEQSPKQPKGQGSERGKRQGDKSNRQGESSGQDEHPARKRIEAARERMRAARQKLQRAERDGAVEEQEEAIRELEQAKAELEEILRQLREEEIEQILAMLQARFLKMLQMQRSVHEGTCRLDEASKDGMTHNQEIEAARLSSQEAEIILEAEKALTLLREEGSAVAFPQALVQVRDDMRQVAGLLAEAKVGQVTQEIEEDVMAALEEMIEALEVAQEDAEKRRNQPPSGGRPGEPRDPSLVDLLAEIKMIRALQLRVNKRTERYSKLIGGERAENAEILEALHLLGQRQKQIHQITRDLERGMNR